MCTWKVNNMKYAHCTKAHASISYLTDTWKVKNEKRKTSEKYRRNEHGRNGMILIERKNEREKVQ